MHLFIHLPFVLITHSLYILNSQCPYFGRKPCFTISYVFFMFPVHTITITSLLTISSPIASTSFSHLYSKPLRLTEVRDYIAPPVLPTSKAGRGRHPACGSYRDLLRVSRQPNSFSIKATVYGFPPLTASCSMERNKILVNK